MLAGNVAKCLIYIDNIRSKNDEKKRELRDYLEKYQTEIINYGRRQAANKPLLMAEEKKPMI